MKTTKTFIRTILTAIFAVVLTLIVTFSDASQPVKIYKVNLSVQITPAVTVISHGQGAWLTSIISGGVGPYAYIWTFNDYVHGDTTVGCGTNLFAVKAGLYKLSVYDSSRNCNASATAIVDHETIPIELDSFQGIYHEGAVYLTWGHLLTNQQ